MSAPSDSAEGPSPCACTNISLMQLFHELKQKFPGVPDHVVSNTIELYRHDKSACETHLKSEAKASLTHAYHASSSAAARQLNELKVNAPLKCRNQPITKHELPAGNTVTAVLCETPQNATVSSIPDVKPEVASSPVAGTSNVFHCDKIIVTPVEAVNKLHVFEPVQNSCLNDCSPVTINIDNCVAKYCTGSPSDLESAENAPESEPTTKTKKSSPRHSPVHGPAVDNTNYRILKSNKVKSNLNEKLEKVKEKKAVSADEGQDSSKQGLTAEKPKRPCTLEFVKPNPDFAFKQQNLPKPEPELSRAISPVINRASERQPVPPLREREGRETVPGGSYWPEHGYPLNLSVNVNCRMDLGNRAGYVDPWVDDYENPRTYTSVNLTVCTPTSSMQSPGHERGLEALEEDARGFEGHVTVTVSPSTARPPRRRAPPPPGVQPAHIAAAQRLPPITTGITTPEATLIARQKERLGRLSRELQLERGRLSQLSRETAILAAPLPPPVAAQKLRDYVAQLREQCNRMAKKLDREITGGEVESNEFYSNIYTGQRPAVSRQPTRPAPPAPAEEPSWQCHVCTFRNHGLLNKCEECDMPRIVVGTPQVRALGSSYSSLSGARRHSAQIENNMLLNNAEGVHGSERQANRVCV